MDHGRQIANIPHQIVVLNAGPSDANGVNFLKSIGADQAQWNLAGDHHNRRRVHVRVVHAGDRVGGAGPGRDQRHTDAPRSPRISFGHVDRALLVTYQVMSDAIACAPQLIIDVQHGAAWITEDRIDTFVHERIDQNFGPARRWLLAWGRKRIRILGKGWSSAHALPSDRKNKATNASLMAFDSMGFQPVVTTRQG